MCKSVQCIHNFPPVQRRTVDDVTFDVVGAAYDRFMGRYSLPLATVFVSRAVGA